MHCSHVCFGDADGYCTTGKPLIGRQGIAPTYASSPLFQPVDKSLVPDYYTIIKNPMDFGTIKNKYQAGEYGTLDQMFADMKLVFSNCRLYNKPDTFIVKMCDNLERVCVAFVSFFFVASVKYMRFSVVVVMYCSGEGFTERASSEYHAHGGFSLHRRAIGERNVDMNVCIPRKSWPITPP